MRYVGAFSPGFERTVQPALERELGRSLSKLSVESGLARFNCDASPERVAKAPILASAYLVFSEFDGSPRFEELARSSPPLRLPKSLRAKSFRVRFMRGGKLLSVDARTLETAERSIARATGLRSSRASADCEFWYVVRAGGGGFFGLLLEDRAERKPEQGELRPSLAAALCEYGAVADGETVLDLFAGHGSLAAAAVRLRDVRAACVEREGSLVRGLERRFEREPRVRVFEGDARALEFEDGTFDLVLADPPWGEFRAVKNIDTLYRDAFGEIRRVLKTGGRAVVLTSRERAVYDLADGLFEKSRTDTLVGGRKATAHLMIKRR